MTSLKALSLGAGIFAAVSLALIQPAQALPGLDLSGGVYGAYTATGPITGLGADADVYVGTPILKASAHLFSVGQANGIGEVVMRIEPLPIPFLSLRPGVGYQGNTYFLTTMDHAPYASILASFGLPLVPVSLDAEVGVSFPLALGKTVISYMGNANLAIIPLVPVTLSGRVRGYQVLNSTQASVMALELGLRVNL